MTNTSFIALVLSIVSLVLVVFASLFFYFYIKRRTEGAVILENYRKEINEMLNEIDRITDRDTVLVQDRVNELKKTLEEIDRRIPLLQKETENKVLHEKAYKAIGERKIVFEKPAPVSEPIPVKQQAQALQQEGLDAAHIAAKLNITIAEVELMLALG
ncbi:MAG: hypothetical protein LBM77_13680 [Spirochaetaceae bacterium]|jgi:hypothetical protein|nr:hypothetical protein [Spirochaetaceae bacterium]